MTKTILAAAAAVTLMAAPALAQPSRPDASHRLDQVSSARSGHVAHASPHRARRGGDGFGAYAQHGPYAGRPASWGWPAVGQPWPGARYDAYGYYIDPNPPDRW
jgi:hypothetical protein